MRKRLLAVSLVELVIAMGVFIFAFIQLVDVFRNANWHASQSRNRTVACCVVQSLMAEMEEHPYGLPAPASWGVEEERPATLWIEGRPHEMLFHKKIEFENGGFVGQSADTTDMVTITLSWKESWNMSNPGIDESSHPIDDREIVVKVPVWK